MFVFYVTVLRNPAEDEPCRIVLRGELSRDRQTLMVKKVANFLTIGAISHENYRLGIGIVVGAIAL